MKSKNHVSKQFFRDNPLEEISAAKIAYFSMTAGFDEEINNFINEHAKSGIESERLEKIQQEQEQLSQNLSAEEIMRMIRGNCDVFNRNLLCKKAIEMQDEVLPLVVRRFLTSVQDAFIETACRVLKHADEKYLSQLINQYQQIRSPYAQSTLCVTLIDHADEELNGFLMKEYYRLAEEYPDESYKEGPLLALHIINGKDW